MFKTVLSQLIDSEEFASLTSEELCALVLKLDEEIVFGTSEVLDLATERST